MRIAYFDAISGISGDMTVGALIDAGIDFEEFRREILKLNLKNFDVSVRKVVRNGISATKFDVIVEKKEPEHRHLSDIFDIIDKSDLSKFVKETSKRVFNTLAQAEAKIHNVSVDQVHFHEVGAVDSIVDIVGSIICIEKLGIEKIYASKIPLGSGASINAQHGKMPIPAPATIEMLKNFPVVLTDVPFELTTPTGSAIIATLAEYGLEKETIKVHSIGYGAGYYEFPDQVNLLRVIVGEIEEKYGEEKLLLVETNIDDMNPEIYPYVIEKLLASGANDAYLVPIYMKKGRPGILLSALVSELKLEDVLKVIFTQTTTLGVRIIEIRRKKLPREQKEIDTPFGKVKFKLVLVNNSKRLVPEFEECKRIAEERNIPLIQVYKILESLVSL
ncbi:MAG: nickel pincer cofactor biosynthesis protein LarC [Candidatus Kryptonium sp.]